MKILYSNILQNIILLQLVFFNLDIEMRPSDVLSKVGVGLEVFGVIMLSVLRCRRYNTLKCLYLTYLLLFVSSGSWWNITILDDILSLFSKDVCATRMRALDLSFIWRRVRITWDRREAKRGWVEMGVGRDGCHLDPYLSVLDEDMDVSNLDIEMIGWYLE